MDLNVSNEGVRPPSQALTPEFVQNAIQNTLIALEGFPSVHQLQQSTDGAAADVLLSSFASGQNPAIPEASHPIDEDEEMMDTVHEQVCSSSIFELCQPHNMDVFMTLQDMLT